MGLRAHWQALAVGLAAVLAALASPALQAQSDSAELTGALARIQRAGVVRMGYRAQSLPFSTLGPGGVPYGYSIDLCLAIVDEIAEAIGGRSLRVEYLPVTPADRIELVESGRIDLECGSTTNTAERRQRVAFSPLTFVTGTRLVVPRGSAVRSPSDLAGHSVAVVRGTSNEAAVRSLIERSGLRVAVVPVDDLAAGFDALRTRRADAFAADEVLLLGHLVGTGQRAGYDLVGRLLSHEPYGIMYARGDAALARTVSAAFARLAQSRELRWIYLRWFERRLPDGSRLGLPMSPELQRAFELLGLPPA